MLLACCLLALSVGLRHPLQALEKSVYFLRHNRLVQQNNWTAVEQNALAALREYPQEILCQVMLNDALRGLKRYRQALEQIEPVFNRAADRSVVLPYYLQSLWNYGWQLYEKGEKAAGFALHEKAYKLAPEEMWNFYRYGLMLRLERRYAAALEILEKGNKKFPAHKPIRDELDLCRAKAALYRTMPGDMLVQLSTVEDPDGSKPLAACFAMLLKVHDRNITTGQVHTVMKGDFTYFGCLQEWARTNHGILLGRHEYGSTADILHRLKNNTAVMVCLLDAGREKWPQYRIVLGCNTARNEVLLTDPYAEGYYYRLPVQEFGRQRLAVMQKEKHFPPLICWTAERDPQDKDDVVLDVPYVTADVDNSCGSCSMAMMLKYLGTPATFNDVVRLAGIPHTEYGTLNYARVNTWTKSRFKIRTHWYHNATVADTVAIIRAGYPLMALQNYHSFRPGGHGRVVVGFNLRTRVLLINDPSEIGYRYRMPFAFFERMWTEHAARFPTDPKNMLMVFTPLDKEPPVARDKKLDLP